MSYRYEVRNAEGRVCCGGDDPNPIYFCDNCKPKLAEQLATTTTTSAPDPYAAGVKTLRERARDATPEATFEATYKAERTRQLQAMRAALDAEAQ